MKYILAIICSFLLVQNSTAQQLSDTSNIRISLLTCAPGSELYSTFGHTALRVVDKMNHTDYVFNYGTFNFDQPNFYLKFVRGKLNFMMSVEPLDAFMYEYQVTHRSVLEQELNLSRNEKREIIRFLHNNYLPANRYYQYDFLFDNCATRIRDIIFKSIKSVKINQPLVKQGTTFRDLLYFYLDRSGQAWSKLGIDMLLGSKLDKEVDNNTAMFLPDFLSKAAANATIEGKPYQLSQHKLIDAPSPIIPSGKYIPLIVLSVVSALFLLLFYLCRKKIFLTNLLDSILLYITGLLGLLMLFMWFGTDHQACADNYNLLWALPTNIVAAFFIWKKRVWVQKYFIITTIITAILLAFWFEIPQHFNIAIIPVAILMLVRYGKLARK